VNLNLSNSAKGYALVFVAVLAMANVYIFSKVSLNLVHLSQFGIYWFGTAIIYNLIFGRKNLSLSEFRKIPKSIYKTIFTIGVLELVGTSLFFIAVKTMTNPALVSFFANSTPVFVSVFAVIFLKERFTFIETIGIVLTVSGAFIIGYQPGSEVPDDFYKALILIICSGLIYSVSTILSKKNITKISASVLTINRTVFLFIGSLILLIITKNNLIIPIQAFFYISLGSLLGPFLASFVGYAALKYIEASKASVLGSSKAFFVLISSYFYFNIIPTELQLAGGIITITGVLLISSGKLITLKINKSVNIRKINGRSI